MTKNGLLTRVPERSWAPRITPTPTSVSPEFGWRLASLADGEGHFGITYTGRGKNCRRAFFVVGLRVDDLDFLRLFRDTLGLGRINITKRYNIATRPGSKPLARWEVARHDDVLALVVILDRYPLLSKKRHEYALWREAVVAWTWGDWDAMDDWDVQLKAARVYVAPPELEGVA